MGKVSIEAKEIVLKKREDLKIAVAKEHVNSKDVFLYHKTTNRNFYDEAYKKCQEQGLADIIFTNELGEITEGCISNIVIKKNGIYYTPPVSCGLLAGVYRQNLLDKKKVVEKKLYIQDLHEADKIFLCNSVRGMRCVFYF